MHLIQPLSILIFTQAECRRHFQSPGHNVWPTDRKYILINVQKELCLLEFMTLKIIIYKLLFLNILKIIRRQIENNKK